MRLIVMIKKLLSLSKETKACALKLSQTQEIRRPIVAQIRRDMEERRRASLPPVTPVLQGDTV